MRSLSIPISEQIPDGLEDCLVGGREFQSRHIRKGYPANRLAFTPPGLTGKDLDIPHVQQDLFVSVVVGYFQQCGTFAHSDVHFFLQFAFQRLLHTFAGGHLATGKLPEPTLMLTVMPFGNEHMAVTVDDNAYRDMHSIRHGIRH